MNKAPSLSLVHGIRKPVEIADNTTPSPSTQTDAEKSSALPPASSATSRTWSWLNKDDTVRQSEYEPPPTRRGRMYHTAVDEGSVSETLDSHRIVIAIDYGTTFTGT